MAQTTGNFIPVINAAQGAISYLENASSTDLSGSLAAITSVTDNQVIMVKDMSITLPKEEADKVDLLGNCSTTVGTGVISTGSFQNQFYDIKSVTDGEVSGTMILTLGNDGTNAKLPDFLDIATGTGQAISTTHHRHTFGDNTASQIKQLTGMIMIVFDNSKTAGVIGMLNPIVNWDEITATGTDGHFEVSFTAKSLAKDFVIEVEDLD